NFTSRGRSVSLQLVAAQHRGLRARHSANVAGGLSALPRPSSIARCTALKISHSFAPLSYQRKHSALGIRAADNPAAWHLSRDLEDLTASRLHALGRRVDVADVEVIEPEGNRHCWRLVEHAANRLLP